MATRRKFIRDCSVLAASVAVVPAPVARARARRQISLSEIALEIFAAQLNTRFIVRDRRGEVQRLKLVEVNTTGNTLARPGTETFSLVFSGTVGKSLDQGSYEFEHAGIGTFEMFIVPVGRRDASVCYYEAVFSRPVVEARLRR